MVGTTLLEATRVVGTLGRRSLDSETGADDTLQVATAVPKVATALAATAAALKVALVAVATRLPTRYVIDASLDVQF